MTIRRVTAWMVDGCPEVFASERAAREHVARVAIAALAANDTDFPQIWSAPVLADYVLKHWFDIYRTLAPLTEEKIP